MQVETANAHDVNGGNSVVHIDRLVDGKIVEHWGQGDTLTIMQQLGVVPSPGPGGS